MREESEMWVKSGERRERLREETWAGRKEVNQINDPEQ